MLESPIYAYQIPLRDFQTNDDASTVIHHPVRQNDFLSSHDLPWPQRFFHLKMLFLLTNVPSFSSGVQMDATLFNDQ